jgi:hypothetical protein
MPTFSEKSRTHLGNSLASTINVAAETERRNIKTDSSPKRYRVRGAIKALFAQASTRLPRMSSHSGDPERTVTLKKFYLPYSASESSDWSLYANGKAFTFHSRREALAFATDQCRKAIAAGEKSAMISIEGLDGQWRSFDSSLSPILNEPILRTQPQH